MDDIKSWAVMAALVGIAGWVIYEKEFSEDGKATKAAEAAAEKAKADEAAKPKLYSEADGCQVYRFSGGGRWLFFTRCGHERTETINQWQTCTGGKFNSCTEHTLPIVQEPKP